jgi:hypothetical protein
MDCPWGGGRDRGWEAKFARHGRSPRHQARRDSDGLLGREWGRGRLAVVVSP